MSTSSMSSDGSDLDYTDPIPVADTKEDEFTVHLVSLYNELGVKSNKKNQKIMALEKQIVQLQEELEDSRTQEDPETGDLRALVAELKGHNAAQAELITVLRACQPSLRQREFLLNQHDSASLSVRSSTQGSAAAQVKTKEASRQQMTPPHSQNLLCGQVHDGTGSPSDSSHNDTEKETNALDTDEEDEIPSRTGSSADKMSEMHILFRQPSDNRLMFAPVPNLLQSRWEQLYDKMKKSIAKSKHVYVWSRTKGCIVERVLKQAAPFLANDDPEESVCRVCFNSRQLCVRYHKDEEKLCIVPLPKVLRSGINPTEIAYWVYQGKGKHRLVEKELNVKIWQTR